MSRYTVKLPSLHPGQHKLLHESRRYNVACCGRRFGKTFLAADVLLDGPDQRGAIHGYPVALYAPSYQTMLESWRKFCHILDPIVVKKSEQDKRLDLLTGGVVEMWSLDNPDAGRGRKYSVICIDEAAMVKRLEEAWTQNIQPLLLDYGGSAWFTSTPKGDNYFKTLFDKGDPRNPNREDDWISWQLPTWHNPHINREDVEKMRASMPRLAFLQEIEAQFVSFAGTFVKAEYLREGQAPVESMRLYQGVDLAISMKENADYTAIVTVGVDEDGRVWIVDAERRRVGFRDALAFIKEKADRWRPVDIGVEVVQYQAAVVEELLRSTNLPVRKVTPDKDKLTRAQGLITRYENGLVYHNVGLSRDYVNEILAFGPDCEHDDMVDAAVYAYMLTGDYGKPRFMFADGESPVKIVRDKAEALNMPGLPDHVVGMIENGNMPDTCGSCINFDHATKTCHERSMIVRSADPGCVLHIAA